MQKAITHREGNDLNIGVMFTKVDKKNRTVSGFATLDNRDKHGDRITADASRKAFAKFMGGIREMHQPSAVGSLVSFEELKKYARDDRKVYSGMHIDARVSKGAPNTWEKVEDGTLRGFSIGGKTLRKHKETDPETGEEYTVIDEYELHEISLVDNPANPLATVLTVKKIGDSFVYPDDEIQKAQMSILYHPESGDVILSEDEDRDGFKNIGWTDSVDDIEKIESAIAEYDRLEKESTGDDEDGFTFNTDGFSLSGANSSGDFASGSNNGNTVTIATQPDITKGAGEENEGGATVANEDKQEETTESVAEQGVVTDPAEADGVVETADVAEVEEEEEVAASADADAADASDDDDTVEKAADVSEVPAEADVDTDAIVKAVTDAVLGAVTQATKEQADAINSVQSSFEKTISDLKTELSEEIQKKVDGLASRVETVESGTAIKKSLDISNDDGDEDDDDEDSFWRGSGFLSTSDLVTVD